MITNKKNKLKFSDMMNKIKNYDNITNNLITNVNMLINPKNFKNSNIKKFYKNISDEKEKNITSNNTIKNFKNNIDEKNFFSKKENPILKNIFNKKITSEKFSGNYTKDNNFSKHKSFPQKKINQNQGKINYDNLKKSSVLSNYPLFRTDYNKEHSDKSSFFKTYFNDSYINNTSKIFCTNKNLQKGLFKEKILQDKLILPEKNNTDNIIYKTALIHTVYEKLNNTKLYEKAKDKNTQTNTLLKTGNYQNFKENFYSSGIKDTKKAFIKTAGVHNYSNGKIFNEFIPKKSGFNNLEKNIHKINNGIFPDEDIKNFGFKKMKDDLSFHLSGKSSDSVTVSPNINIEIKPQNPAADFNKIWSEIGDRLNSEINSSVNGFHT